MELDGCVHAGVAFVVDGVVSIGIDVSDGHGCFVGRVVEIVGESCVRVGTPAWQRGRGGTRRWASGTAGQRDARNGARLVAYDCRKRS